MQPALERTVLFANVLGCPELRAARGSAAAGAMVAERLVALKAAAESCGAKVMKTMPEKLMVLAARPDPAAEAAASMQAFMENAQAAEGARLGLGVGFHHGPVIELENDVYGSTVNLAARVAEQAAGGNVLTTQSTARRLGALHRSLTRPLYAVRVRGVAGEVDLCELLWRSDGEATLAPAAQPVPPRPAALSLTCGGREYIHRRGREEITIGRDESCDFVVADAMASRQHCTIERRVDRFVLTDHSANGTYVSIDGETEAVLHRAELVLHKSGWIAFGQPRLAAAGAMQFSCREPA